MHDTDPKPGGTPSAQPDDVTAITLARLPSGRWSARGDSCVGSGESRREALAALGGLLDDWSATLPQIEAWGREIAAERAARRTRR